MYRALIIYSWYALGKKLPTDKIHRVAHPHNCYETSGRNGLSKKQNEGLLFENRAGAMVNEIFQITKQTKRSTKLTGILQDCNVRRNLPNRKYISRRSIYQI